MAIKVAEGHRGDTGPERLQSIVEGGGERALAGTQGVRGRQMAVEETEG
jgi:hypothetical protein